MRIAAVGLLCLGFPGPPTPRPGQVSKPVKPAASADGLRGSLRATTKSAPISLIKTVARMCRSAGLVTLASITPIAGAPVPTPTTSACRRGERRHRPGTWTSCPPRIAPTVNTLAVAEPNRAHPAQDPKRSQIHTERWHCHPERAPGKREQTRAELLVISGWARGVFAENGLQAATVRDIIRRTNLSVGFFYNYYRSEGGGTRPCPTTASPRLRPILARIPVGARLQSLNILRRHKRLFPISSSTNTSPGAMWSARNERRPLRGAAETPEMQAVFDAGALVHHRHPGGAAHGPAVDTGHLAAACIAIAREEGAGIVERRFCRCSGGWNSGADDFRGLPALPNVPSGIDVEEARSDGRFFVS